MFRSLGGAIDKKAKSFGKNAEANTKLNRAFARFLEESFPEGKGMDFGLSISNQRVVIQTSNKSVANEIILKIADLSRVFKEEGVSSMQIVIR